MISKQLSEHPVQTRPKSLLIAGGVGCILLICVLLIGIGSYYFLAGDANVLTDLFVTSARSPTPDLDTSTSVPEATYTSVPTLTPEETAERRVEIEDGVDNPESIETPLTDSEDISLSEPEISTLSFATGITNDNVPISPATSFKAGVTEIHAIFEYNGMSADFGWERVWYLNGTEILRNPKPGDPKELWPGPGSGVFDYFINNGGDPLPSGEWMLEIYVDDNLLATGTFVIESEKDAQLITEAEDAMEHAPDIAPTSTLIPTPQPRLNDGGTFQLAYSKYDGIFHNIYIADTNGQNEVFIIARAAGPSFSPDKSRLYFFGEQGINLQMHRAGENRVLCEFGTISGGIVALDLMSPLIDICDVQYDKWNCERKEVNIGPEPADACSANGISIYQRLDWKEGTARWASVAPDNTAIVYDGTPGGHTRRLYFRDVVGGYGQSRFEILGEQASWSPDSQKLVYRSGRDNKQGLWISNRDDSGHTLIYLDGTASFPSWSPNGQTIAFSREVNNNWDIYTIDVDGSNLQQLTDASGPDTLPVFTPDGKQIVFRSSRNNTWGIWKMNSNGSNQELIIPNAEVGVDWTFSRMDVK